MNRTVPIRLKELRFSKEAEEELILYSDIVLALVKHAADYWETPDSFIANNAWNRNDGLCGVLGNTVFYSGYKACTV